MINDGEFLSELLEFEATAVVQVVIFRMSAAGQPTPAEGDRPVDLTSTTPLDARTTAVLLDSTVRLVAPYDAPAELVAALRALPIPTAFAASAWLRDHRALVVEIDRPSSLAGHTLGYAPSAGLLIRRGEQPA